MRNLIILNPSSLKGKVLKVKSDVESAFKKNGLDYEIHISKSSKDIISTVKANLNIFSNFISLGGDGTLHHMANALAGTEKNLGCIPMGSGNDIAKNLNLPFDLDSCCLAIKNCRVKRIDLGLINNSYYYLGVSGAGFDSVVTDLANNTKFPIKGPAKYKYAVYRTLLTYRSKKFFIKFNDNERTIDAMFLVAANMPMYGGGMKIAPEADPTDGILDICIIKRMNKVHFIKAFPTVFQGRHLSDPFVEYFKVSSIEIDSEYNFSVFADGEYICKLPARYEVIPKALNFIAAP
ncbi:MAG: diacylglycerol kinase family lipid kinase [Actinobacteria bacterium]|nr:diacylglycerol kinase family lipid kinase [Actinomycetota bacterium]